MTPGFRPPSPVPRVSVGLPVYNGERYLRTTLADWRRQTVADFELLVVDNASTDATEAICREAAAEDERIRYVRNARNIGALPNANRAFALARAPLYALSAHDDRHAPDFLERLVAALDADPGAVLAYGDQTLIGSHGERFAFDPEARVYHDAAGGLHDYDAALQRPMPDDPVERFRAVLEATDINAPIHGLFRREVAARVGPHQIWGSDRLIVAHAALLGRFAYVDAPLFAYRIHERSTVFLDRAAWMERDTGRAAAGSFVDPLRSLGRYLSAVRDAPLGRMERLAAAGAVLGRGVGTRVLRNAMVPGPDNYWGWTGAREMDAREGDGAERSGRKPGARRWAWANTETGTSASDIEDSVASHDPA